MLAGLLQLENSNLEGDLRRKFDALSRDAYGFAPTEELQFWRCCAQEICCSRVSIPLSPVSRQLNKWMGKKYILLEGLRTRKPPQSFRMSASKLSVQLGLRYNWRISMLQVLHAGNLLCAGIFIMKAGFRSPFSGLDII